MNNISEIATVSPCVASLWKGYRIKLTNLAQRSETWLLTANNSHPTCSYA